MLYDLSLDSLGHDISEAKKRLEHQSAAPPPPANPNRFETRLLLQQDTTERNGIVTPSKFIRICMLLKEVNKKFGNTDEVPFQVPDDVSTVFRDGTAYNVFVSFYHRAMRLPKRHGFNAVLGYAITKDPDDFIDYLLTLLDKNITVSTYVPALLESVSMRGVKKAVLQQLVQAVIDRFVDFVLVLRPSLPNVRNLGLTCGNALTRFLLLPLVRHALISPSPLSNTSFLGIEPLPGRVRILLKGDLLRAWSSLFGPVDRHEYDTSSSSTNDAPLQSFTDLINSLDNHAPLKFALDGLYKELKRIPNMRSRDASVLVLVVYTTTHYVVRTVLLHLISTGETLLTQADFMSIVDGNSGLRALMHRQAFRPMAKIEDDPELFFSFAQKSYIKVIMQYWKSIVENWPLMDLQQKKKLREAVQAKIIERLEFDRILLTEHKKKLANKEDEGAPLDTYDFYSL